MKTAIQLLIALALTACGNLQPTNDETDAKKLQFVSLGNANTAAMIIPVDFKAHMVIAESKKYCRIRKPCKIFGSHELTNAAALLTYQDKNKADFYYFVDEREVEIIQFYCAAFQDADKKYCVQR